MKNFILNEKKVKLPSNWEEVTWKKFLGFTKIIQGIELNENSSFNNEIEEFEAALANLEGNTKIVSYWCDITSDEIAMCDLDEIALVLNHLSFLNTPYDHKMIEKFKIGNQEFILPNEIMAGSSFGRYIEAEQLELHANILEKGKIDVLPKQIAILCKKEGENEKLDDKVINARATLFEKLSMATIWDVAFFLSKLEQRLILSTLIYQEGEATLKQQ